MRHESLFRTWWAPAQVVLKLNISRSFDYFTFLVIFERPKYSKIKKNKIEHCQTTWLNWHHNFLTQ
jgi:hypothetical protein